MISTHIWLQHQLLYRIQTTNTKAMQIISSMNIADLAGDGWDGDGNAVRLFTVGAASLQAVIAELESEGVEMQMLSDEPIEQL